jgi:hypothetical protein
MWHYVAFGLAGWTVLAAALALAVGRTACARDAHF